MIIILAVVVLAASRAGVLAAVLAAVAAGLVYALAALVRPVRRCPRCKGRRVAVRGQRVRGCARCKGTGRARRRGAPAIHRFAWSVLGSSVQRRLDAAHEELREKAGQS